MANPPRYPKLSGALAAKGVQQQDIAALLSLPPSQVSSRMLGRISWRLAELQKIARHLGVPVADLIDDDAPHLAETGAARLGAIIAIAAVALLLFPLAHAVIDATRAGVVNGAVILAATLVIVVGLAGNAGAFDGITRRVIGR